MQQLPAPARPMLRRLARRLTLGLFLDRWPAWAAVSLLAAGTVVLMCRLLVPAASPILPWLWLAPVVVAIPAAVLALRRAYTPSQIVAAADWLTGGHGTLMTISERSDLAWMEPPVLDRTSAMQMPRLRPWRQLRLVAFTAAFLLAAQLLPQRTAGPATDAALADEIAADLTTALEALAEEQVITPEEEQRLEEEVERIRRDAERRVDASTWEAADALREQMAATLAAKQNALQWAQQAATRLAASLEAGAGDAQVAALTAELAGALDKLAQHGMSGAADLKKLLQAGKLPGDAAAMAKLAAELGAQLDGVSGRFAEGLGQGRGFGRFDPSEFPLSGSGQGPPGGKPGRGGVNRGRADAELMWGKESQRLDRFKAQTLPPGAARSPDDWAPIVVLPGAPQESSRTSTAAAARAYDALAGQGAWRRSLAPRHQTAVKKYFEK